MSKMNTRILVMCALLGIGSSVPLLEHRTAPDALVRDCLSAGLMCEDCTHLVSCFAEGDGQFTKIPISTCTNGTTCFANECTPNRNPACEAHPPFVCKTAGVFPDQFECRKYHFCMPETNDTVSHKAATCETGFAYRVSTKDCRRKLRSNFCFDDVRELPVPLCENAGQSEALKENPNMYYICAQYDEGVSSELYPFLYSCPRGGIYKDYECVYPEPKLGSE